VVFDALNDQEHRFTRVPSTLGTAIIWIVAQQITRCSSLKNNVRMLAQMRSFVLQYLQQRCHCQEPYVKHSTVTSVLMPYRFIKHRVLGGRLMHSRFTSCSPTAACNITHSKLPVSNDSSHSFSSDQTDSAGMICHVRRWPDQDRPFEKERISVRLIG